MTEDAKGSGLLVGSNDTQIKTYFGKIEAYQQGDCFQSYRELVLEFYLN